MHGRRDLRRDRRLEARFSDAHGLGRRELAAESGTALYIPKGFAHGFQTLVDGAEVFYMISDPYVPEAASGVRWDDPAFGIDWPSADARIINERDRSWPDYRPDGGQIRS